MYFVTRRGPLLRQALRAGVCQPARLPQNRHVGAAGTNGHIGVPKLVSRDGRGTVEFTVIADGQDVYETPALRGWGTCKRAALDISEAKELRLIVADADDRQTCDRAAWGDAKTHDASRCVT